MAPTKLLMLGKRAMVEVARWNVWKTEARLKALVPFTSELCHHFNIKKIQDARRPPPQPGPSKKAPKSMLSG